MAMLTLWYFDRDPIGSTPEHIYTGNNPDAAFEALCDRFGAWCFDMEETCNALARPDSGYVIDLPGETRVAVLKHH